MNALLSGIALAMMAVSPQEAPTSDIDVRVNGNPVRFQTVFPQDWYGRLLVPLKPVVASLGGTTSWNPRTTSLKVRVGSRTAHIKIRSQVASMDDRDFWLDVAPRTTAGITMVPITFFNDAFGADVRWNTRGRVATIDLGPGRRSSARTASVDDASSRREGIADQEFDSETPERRQYRAMFSAADEQVQKDYDRFLLERDFKQYQTDRAAWIVNFQHYQDGLTANGGQGAFKPSDDYMQFIRDRDFELYDSNQTVWRTNYQAFLRWRRTMSATRTSPAFDQYLKDRAALAAQFRRTNRRNGNGSTPLP